MSCVILTLGEELEFTYYSICPDTFKDSAGSLYCKYYADDDNGFYDWLRCVKGEIIGVRWFPYEDDALRGKQTIYLKTLNNISLDDDLLGLTIYFYDFRSIDEPRSCDQDFLQNNLFFSKNGKCAISFSIDNLTEEEELSLPRGA